MTSETKRRGIGEDIGDFVAGEWRRRWRLCGWGVETILET